MYMYVSVRLLTKFVLCLSSVKHTVLIERIGVMLVLPAYRAV